MKSLEPRQLRAMLREARKRLNECRQADFDRGRVNSSAATEDALSRFLLLDELVNGGGALELESD